MDTLNFQYWPSGWERKGIRLFPKQGEVRTGSVLLDRRMIPIETVVGTGSQGKELLISVNTPRGRDDVQITIAPGIFGGEWGFDGASKARRVEKGINRSLSGCRLQRRRQELAGQGKPAEVRWELCPHCQAMVDLSGFPPSPQVLCHYCGTLGTLGHEPLEEETRFGICGSCHFFGCPEPFTSRRVVYLIFWFYTERETATLCGACMRTEALTNLRGNLITVVGAPISIMELVQARFRGSRRSARFAELDAANFAASQGRFDRADILYERLLARNRVAAGLHYNRAKLRYDWEDWTGALEKARSALDDCANYLPAVGLACRSLVRLGRLDEAEALGARFPGIVNGVDS